MLTYYPSIILSMQQQVVQESILRKPDSGPKQKQQVRFSKPRLPDSIPTFDNVPTSTTDQQYYLNIVVCDPDHPAPRHLHSADVPFGLRSARRRCIPTGLVLSLPRQ